jgi:hypothetical protein
MYLSVYKCLIMMMKCCNNSDLTQRGWGRKLVNTGTEKCISIFKPHQARRYKCAFSPISLTCPILLTLQIAHYPKMSSSSGTPESWISSFCSLLGHEYFAEISEDFIEDDFNLTGLNTQVAMYKEALEVCSNLFG